jgi:putative endonuclease
MDSAKQVASVSQAEPGSRAAEVGRRGEELAVQFLWKKNYRILHRNFRGPHGELDIIAERDGRIYFVEVKTRTSHRLGKPEERVDSRKRQHLRATANHYLAQFPEAPPAGYTFAVFAQVLDEKNRVVEQNFWEEAF